MIKLKHFERFYPLAKEKFFYVLRDINLDVEEGDFVSVMGPSGAANRRFCTSSECTITAGAVNIFSMIPQSTFKAERTSHASQRADRLRFSAVSSAR